MLTVIMASRNGAGWLKETLDAFAALHSPEGGWKLVVVDNGSTDRTSAVVRGFQQRLPLTALHQARPGKNAALNLALEEAEGDLVVFTDDDVLPDPDWLLQLRQAAADFPDTGVFGGRIDPCWPRPPARWITDLVPLGLVYSLTVEREDGPCDPQWIWGPNMMVRSALLEGGHRFDEEVGPDGTMAYRMGSETTFTKELAAQGARCRHVARARVRHMIRPFQMKRSWILGRAFRAGRGYWEPEPERVAILGVPRHILREVGEAAGRWAVARLRGNARERFRAAWDLNFWRGVLHEAWINRARPKRRADASRPGARDRTALSAGPD